MSVRTYTLHEIVRIVVRRRWLILLPFAFGLAAAPLLARYAPERYRSEALLLVIPQQVPNDYVTPTMTQPIEERLPAITDQILSRSRLEQIIQQLELYKDEQSREVMEDIVARMRRDVRTSAVGKDVNSFRVSYVSDNAEKARTVTERLASLYIEQNLKDRENQADSTSQFLTAQLAEAKTRLIEQEKKLEDYR
ncbi:MAG: Wzz/FepE/Etk N-terminal domain-containing protein, partial [Vicinamibacterales bacterium]